MSRQPFQRVQRETVERYGPGEEPDPARPPRPGDFILTHSDELSGRLIRFGQGLRIYGGDRRFTHWNHAALLVDDRGGIMEALGAGVKRGNLSKYTGTEYHLIRIEAAPVDRDEVVRFGVWCLNQPYGWLTIVSIAFTLLTGGKFSFMIDGQEICSGLVARALERTNAIFNRDPAHIMRQPIWPSITMSTPLS